MRQFRIEMDRVPEDIRPGLKEIINEYPDRFETAADGVPLRFEKDAPARAGWSATKGEEILVRYGRRTDAFRALGRLMGEGASDTGDIAESPQFDLAGVMVDVSRNGVVRPETMRALLRRFALMGLNMAILYAEDTYEVPGEPFFGYLRGRYTREEMRAIDRYAALFGIEMFPCIQTLAHMAQVLQWPDYAEYKDTNHVLMAEEEKTYELLERMIEAASAPFRSDRIHIGMDEAHGIGSGRYKQIHGEKPPFEILNDHLTRVRDICSGLGLDPMIWSDMYFRLGSETNDYYDPDSVIPPEVVERIPQEVQLVYWDYYHSDSEFYCEWIDRHRALGSEPVVAGGVWTWNRFWTINPVSFNNLDACMSACREKSVREVFVTMWGDDGTECDIFSALPGLQYFAEHAYGTEVELERVRANFRGSCDADFDAWVRASDLDVVPCIENPGESIANVSKWLLWQDPLLAIMDPHLEGIDLRTHYEELADELLGVAEDGGEAGRLRFPGLIARALVTKAHLRRDLAAAYEADDRPRLQRFVDEDLPTLHAHVEELWKCHRQLWMSTYKPFGWEVLESRYGGLMARLNSVSTRLQEYLTGETEEIPELAAELHPVFDLPEGSLPVVRARRVTTPSCIK